jgi:hypothetical protein
MTQLFNFFLHLYSFFLFSSYDHDTDNNDNMHSKYEKKSARIGRGYEEYMYMQTQTHPHTVKTYESFNKHLTSSYINTFQKEMMRKKMQI